MIVGFTGTRYGMTQKQSICFQALIESNYLDIEEFHHGVCVGSDYQAHLMVANWSPNTPIYCHNPIEIKWKADCDVGNIIDLPPKDYLKRNRDIVDVSDVLIATPFSVENSGGTWYTINYAKACKKDYIIFFADGKVEMNVR